MWFVATATAAPSVDVAVAPRVITRTEQLYSPLAYVAPALGGRVGVAVPAGPWAAGGGLDVAYGTGRSGPSFPFTADGEALETPPSSLVNVRLHSMVTREVPAAGWLALGLGPSLDVSLGTYTFGRGGVLTYYGATGFDLGASVAVPAPGRHAVDVSVTVPVAAWVARSPYALNDDPYIETVREGGGLGSVFGLLGRGRLQTWNRRQAVSAAVRWRWDTRKLVQPLAAVDAAVEHHVAQTGESLVRTSVGVAVGARFGGR